MKGFEISVKDRFYDERNGRYLTVFGIERNSNMVYCDVDEMDEEGDFESADPQAFTIDEMTHFQRVADLW